MKRFFPLGLRPKHLIALLAGLIASSALSAAAQMTPGTVKLLSKNATYKDATTGETFVELKNDLSAKYLVIGPEILQADLRFNLAPNETTAQPAIIAVLAGGKEVARFKVTPTASTNTWKGRTDVKPGTSIGFYIDAQAGPSALEFKVMNAPRNAGFQLLPKSKAKTALPATAQTVSTKPAPAATPVPTANPVTTSVARATPIPTPVVVNTPVALESIEGKGPKASEIKKTRRTYEAMVKLGFVTPAHEEFSGTAAIGAEARWAFGARRTIAAGLEAQTLSFSAIVPDDPARAEPPSAVDVQLIPISLNAAYLVPLESPIQPWIAVGATGAYGSSLRRFRDGGKADEAVFGFGGQAQLGVSYDLAGTDLEEGSSKVFLEMKASYLSVPFEEHPFTDWSSVQVLGGIAMKF